MNNTFWTQIDDLYYRIHNNILKYAPICKETSKILVDKKSIVQVISSERLEKVNKKFGSNFKISDFN